MIELAIKGALERITGMNAYPLLLPDTVQEGATFQRISDPEIVSGMLRTGIVSARIQVNLYRLDDYTSLLQLDKKNLDGTEVRRSWPAGGYPGSVCGARRYPSG